MIRRSGVAGDHWRQLWWKDRINHTRRNHSLAAGNRQEDPMLMIRELMYCKPGKVKPMIEKFVAMSKMMEKNKMGRMRVLTDVSGERYWTLVAEFEVESLDKFMAMDTSPEMKELEPLMKGYHDLVDHGRREIYKIEA
jgi:hypothetical protein